MMKVARLGNSDHATPGGRLNFSGDRSAPLEREVRTRLVIVADVAFENPAQMVLAEHDHVVQTLSPD